MVDLIVRKAHPIIEAGYKLSLAEQRIILLSLAQLDNRDVTQSRVILYVKDYAEKFGVPENVAYRDLLNASKRLYDRSIILKGEDETTEFRWIESRTRYHKGEGRISFEFSRKVMPYLFDLDRRLGYTQYHLLSVSGFSSTYSIRLYELCTKMQCMINKVVTVDEIRRILMLEDKYLQYREFNKFVLKVAINEINEKSDLLVEVEQIKRGRSIYALRFTIKPKQAVQSVEKIAKRPRFPHKNKYGRYVKLDTQNPKMSSAEYGAYAKDCLKILEEHYTDIAKVTDEDLRNYWLFLAVNDSHKSKLGGKADFLNELKKRGYKIVNCELAKIEN